MNDFANKIVEIYKDKFRISLAKIKIILIPLIFGAILRGFYIHIDRKNGVIDVGNSPSGLGTTISVLIAFVIFLIIDRNEFKEKRKSRMTYLKYMKKNKIKASDIEGIGEY